MAISIEMPRLLIPLELALLSVVLLQISFSSSESSLSPDDHKLEIVIAVSFSLRNNLFGALTVWVY